MNRSKNSENSPSLKSWISQHRYSEFFFMSLSTLLLGLLGYVTLNTFKYIDEFDHLENVLPEIILYDEILTNSVTLAASTGESKWIDRYVNTEKKLDLAIKGLEHKVSHSAKVNLNMLDNTNQLLVSTEKKALALIENRQPEAARQLLASNEYLTLKKIYEKNFNQILQYSTHFFKQKKTTLKYWLTLSATVTLLIIVAFLLLLGKVNKIMVQEHSDKKQIKRLLNIISNHPGAIAIFDTDMKYIAWSKSWSESYNITHDLQGKSHYEVFKNISDEWQAIHQEALKGATRKCDEDHFKLNDGSDYWLRWVVGPWFTANDQIGGITMLTENITEQKLQAEKLLEQTKLASIGSMTATIAHEIRNPVMIIDGYIRILKKKLKNEQNREFLEKLNKANTRIKTLMEGLRKTSRVNDKADSEINLNDLVFDNVDFIKILYEADGIKINLQQEDRDLHVLGNYSEITQVLSNLISNARDASADLHTRKISLQIKKIIKNEQEYAQVQVTDNGTGIPENIRDKIFDRFFTTKDRDMGTGIGLDISKELIEAHRGYLWFETSPNGTSFYIELPVHLPREGRSQKITV